MPELFDVIVVGGGPAGLSAATVLARSRRRVVVYDAGNPRNIRSHGMHGYLTREGMRPPEFLRIAREQIAGYGAIFREDTVMSAHPEDDGRFTVSTLRGETARCRMLLLATGVVDKLPCLDGIDAMYGISVHHCPYCDGWEHKDEPIAVYGKGTAGANMALSMLTWSRDVVLCTDGPGELKENDKERLGRQEIRIYEQPVRSLEHTLGSLSAINFADGTCARRTALFFVSENVQRSKLPAELGCRINEKDAVEVDSDQCSSVPGVYVVGDASIDSQYVVIAAAEGAKAGMVINRELQKEDLR